MRKQDATNVKLPTPAIEDSGKVRMGGMSPSLVVRAAPASIADTGKVQLGGMSPPL